MIRYKLASPEERAAAFLAVHEVWPRDPDPQKHLALRLASPQQQRADCFVALDEKDQLCASCLAYPHSLFGPGGERPARSFGAVHTPSARRGQGHASALLRYVMAEFQAQGVQDFTLFSDINPAYYERLGFVVVPSSRFEVPASRDAAADWALGELPPRRCPAPSAAFEWGFGCDRDYDLWVLRKHQLPLSAYLVRGPDGMEGVVLLQHRPEALEVLELELPMNADTWPVLRGLFALLAARAGCPIADGWWCSPELPQGEGVTPRPDEILMWASLRGEDLWRTLPGRAGMRCYLSEHV